MMLVRRKVSLGAIGAVLVLAALQVPAFGAGQPSATEWSLSSAPSGHDLGLSSIACTTVTACVAGGSRYSSSKGNLTLIAAEKGTVWSSAGGAVQGSLGGISCPARTWCVAVGTNFPKFPGLCPSPSYCALVAVQSTSSPSTPVLLTGSGSSWHAAHLPVLPSGSAGLFSVACTSVDSCTAVGFQKTGALVLVWNGSRWVSRSLKKSQAALIYLAEISCPAARTCVAAGASESGDAVLATLQDNTWNFADVKPAKGTADYPLGVACPTTTFCTAVGTQDGSMLALQGYGATWRAVTTAHVSVPKGAGAFLSGVSCPKPTDCVSVGWVQGKSASTPIVEEWGNGEWTTDSVPSGIDGALVGVSCRSSSTCVAVGLRSTQGALVLKD